MKKQLFWLLILVLSSVANAGEVVLNNGDRLSGEMDKIGDGKLYWLADSVGEVTIGLDLIDSLETTTEFSTAELTGPCRITGINNGNINYRCDSGQSGGISLAEPVAVAKYVDPNVVPVTYRGKLIASGRQSMGNTEEKSYSVDSETTYRRGDHRQQSKIDFDSLDNDTDDAGDRLVLRYEYDWFFAQRWYWYNALQGRYDEPADIDSRYTYGTGLGFQVFDSDTTALALQSGVTYVRETLEEPQVFDPTFEATDSYGAWEWSLDYRYLLFGKAQFFHKHQLIKSLEESEDWTLETETGVTAPFIGTLYGEIKVDYDVDNSPAEDKRREDTQINIGIGYTW